MKNLILMVLLSLLNFSCGENQDNKILSNQEEINTRLDFISERLTADQPLTRLEIMRSSFDSLVAFNYASANVDIDTLDNHPHINLRYVEYYTFVGDKTNLWDGTWTFNRSVVENFDLFAGPESIHNIIETPIIYEAFGKYRIVDERSIDMVRDGGQSYSLRLLKWFPLESTLMALTNYILGEDNVYFGDTRGGLNFRTTHLSNLELVTNGMLDF